MNILRPLSPHLPIYKPQLTSTFPISHRISGAFLATMVLFSPNLCPKIGLICLTHQNFYQSSPISSKFIPSLVSLTYFALGFHLFHGVRQIIVDLLLKFLKYFMILSLILLMTFEKTDAMDDWNTDAADDWSLNAIVNQMLSGEPNPAPPVGEDPQTSHPAPPVGEDPQTSHPAPPDPQTSHPAPARRSHKQICLDLESLVKKEIIHFTTTYVNDLLNEYPKADRFIKTEMFLEECNREFWRGFANLMEIRGDQLRQTELAVKETLSLVEEFHNNEINSSIKKVLRKFIE